MVHQLHIPELPKPESKRILALFTNNMKRNRFKKCMIGLNCEGKVIQGHLVSRSWLGKIAESNEVYVFTPYSPPNIFAYGDKRDSFGKDHINNALTRYFTCKKHEEMFFPIDPFDCDVSALHNNHLVLHKSILAQMWIERLMLRCFQRLSTESPENEIFQKMSMAHSENLEGLRRCKKMTEKCLDPDKCNRCQGGPCEIIGCRIYHLQGKSTIAASQFSSGAELIIRRLNEYEHHIQPLARCAITVIPTNTGHTFLWHYFLEEKHMIQRELDHVDALKERELEAYISAMLLSDCENIAISPRFWHEIEDVRQNAIRDRFNNDLPDIGIGTKEMIEKWNSKRLNHTGLMDIPNPKQINLFNSKR